LDGVARVGAHALDLSAGEPPVDALAAIHGLYWLCPNRAELGPVAIVVGDAQWVDGPSLAWLGYLVRRVEDLKLLLVLALRSGDPGGDRPQLIRLLADGAGQRIALAPLSTEGVAAIGTSVLARLGRLGADAVALARAVAVLGPGAEVAVAAALAELDPVACKLVADRLAAAQIFTPARPLEFFHPLIGQAVREDISPGALRVAHRRAAALVHGNGSTGRVAAHLLACAPAADGWVLEQLNAAARDALERGAPEVAAAYLQRSLSEPPPPSERAGVLLSLGTAE
jgi:hypothetical protein